MVVNDDVRATVEMVGGVPVLRDPDGCEVIRAVGKHNCKATFAANAERVRHFKERASILGWDSPVPLVVVILAVDDVAGGELASALMPGHDWKQYRDRGEVPFARGLAGRTGIQAFLDEYDPQAAAQLRATAALPVVVVDHGVAEVFEA